MIKTGGGGDAVEMMVNEIGVWFGYGDDGDTVGMVMTVEYNLCLVLFAGSIKGVLLSNKK